METKIIERKAQVFRKGQDPIGQMIRLFSELFPEEPGLTVAEATEMVDDNNAIVNRLMKKRKSKQ